MEHRGTVEVFYKNKKNSGTEIFYNEHLDIGRSSTIGIINCSEKESELISTLKLWNELDISTGVKTYLKFKSLPMIDSYREYYIQKVNEEMQMIVLNWPDNY